MEIAKVIFIVLEVLVLFNLLIIVHELGHFLAAKWRGLVVERFGIWFGKAIWEKKVRGVFFSLGCIPAGGFVQLPQMAPMEALEGESQIAQANLPPVSPLDKIIVAFAGPLFSFLLALVFAFLVWGVGRPVTESEGTTVIGYVAKDSPAEKAGLKPGDRVLTIDGHKITRFQGMGDSVQWRVISSEGEKITIVVERDGQQITREVTPKREETKPWERGALREIQVFPATTPIVAGVKPHSPAALAGITTNDVITKVNGEFLYSNLALADIIEKKGRIPYTLEVQRGGVTKTFVVTPEIPAEAPPDQKRLRLGIEWDLVGRWHLDHPKPWEQVRLSFNSMVSTFGALFSTKSDVKAQHLSGPVGILGMYFKILQSEHGWRLAIWFSVIFNVNLAILNLLPIPVLDGGHIVLAIVEAVRRKTVSISILQHVQTACAVMLIGFILYVTFFDVQGFFGGKREKPATEIKFAPKPATQP